MPSETTRQNKGTWVQLDAEELEVVVSCLEGTDMEYGLSVPMWGSYSDHTPAEFAAADAKGQALLSRLRGLNEARKESDA